MEVNNNEYHMLEHKTSGLLIILDWVGLFVGEVELEKSFVETQGSFSSSNKLAFLQWFFVLLDYVKIPSILLMHATPAPTAAVVCCKCHISGTASTLYTPSSHTGDRV